MKKSNNISDDLIGKVSEKLSKAKHLSIITHINPDGDAIGSSLGLYHFLSSLGYNVSFITPNDFPAFLKWMTGSSESIDFKKDKDTAINKIEISDLIFCLDFNSLSRIKELGKELSDKKDKIILIDHHPDPEDFANIIISNTYASSASEVVYYFIKALKPQYNITQDIAECLFSGIMTDTGCFTHGAMSSTTFETLASLMSTGMNKEKVYSNIYDNFSEQRMRLMGYCLHKKMEIVPEFNSAYISITEQELDQFNFEIGDTEGLVNLPFSVKGIKLAALFIEKKDYIKVSLRSKGDINVNDLARKHYNGGGHMKAAGGEIKMSLEETIINFKQILKDYSNNLK